jgi:hypothetical protein
VDFKEIVVRSVTPSVGLRNRRICVQKGGFSSPDVATWNLGSWKLLCPAYLYYCLGDTITLIKG